MIFEGKDLFLSSYYFQSEFFTLHGTLHNAETIVHFLGQQGSGSRDESSQTCLLCQQLVLGRHMDTF